MACIDNFVLDDSFADDIRHAKLDSLLRHLEVHMVDLDRYFAVGKYFVQRAVQALASIVAEHLVPYCFVLVAAVVEYSLAECEHLTPVVALAVDNLPVDCFAVVVVAYLDVEVA